MRSSHSFFDPVSEGPCCCRQNHEGPGHQRRWPGGLWGVCFSGCWTVHCLWAVLSDAHEEGVKEVKTRQQKRLEESQKSISIFAKIVLSIKYTDEFQTSCVWWLLCVCLSCVFACKLSYILSHIHLICASDFFTCINIKILKQSPKS